jgi:Protein of unknown function (DUF4238)
MNNSTPTIDNFFKKNSSRHHYIPQFLINGFTNSNGLLYVYDKQVDKILTKQKPPKSIFFETDRNTVEIKDNIKSSIIEDYLYADIDNKTSKVIKYFQEEELSKIDFKVEDTATLLFFLISLFWRIPKTDYAAEDLMNRSIITSNGIDPEKLRNDPTYRKINRAGLFKHHIDEMKNFGMGGEKWSNIHQNETPIYVIGDFPFLSRKQTNEFRKFNDTDILLAVSSTRIYSSTNESLKNFSPINSYSYNASIIHQSIKYIACGDLKVLEQSINFYKKLKSVGLIIFK